MKIEDLKDLESKATPAPWNPRSMTAGTTDDGEWAACGPVHDPSDQGVDDEDEADMICEAKAEADAKLLLTLRNVAPEIIPLVQSVNLLCYPPEDCPATCLTQLAVVRENLDWLNSKLADL